MAYRDDRAAFQTLEKFTIPSRIKTAAKVGAGIGGGLALAGGVHELRYANRERKRDKKANEMIARMDAQRQVYQGIIDAKQRGHAPSDEVEDDDLD